MLDFKGKHNSCAHPPAQLGPLGTCTTWDVGPVSLGPSVLSQGPVLWNDHIQSMVWSFFTLSRALVGSENFLAQIAFVGSDGQSWTVSSPVQLVNDHRETTALLLKTLISLFLEPLVKDEALSVKEIKKNDGLLLFHLYDKSRILDNSTACWPS